jgi:cobalt/nickel transport system permease protein
VTLSYRDPAIPDSPPARWDPRWKLAAMFVDVVVVAILKTPVPLAIALGLALLALAFARVPIVDTAARTALLLLAIAPFAVVLPLFVENGWSLAMAIALRCVAIGLIGYFLLRTTPLPSIVAAARSLGLPGTIVLVAQLAYRYAQVLFGEARRLRVAMRARAFRPRTTAHTYRAIGHAAGALLVSGGERAERVAAAMKCRGFDGSPRMLTAFRTTTADVLAFLVVATLAGALVAWERWP